MRRIKGRNLQYGLFLLAVMAAVLFFGGKRRGAFYENFSEIKSDPDMEPGQQCTSNKEQMIFFHMTGCPHCDKIKPKWAEWKSSKAADKYQIREFEVSAAPNVCKTYGVTGFPAFVHADANGNVLSRDRPV